VAVRGSHHHDVGPGVVEPRHGVHPRSLDLRLALQFKTKFDEESDGSCEIVDDNADVVHPPKRHAPNIARRTSEASSSADPSTAPTGSARVRVTHPRLLPPWYEKRLRGYRAIGYVRDESAPAARQKPLTMEYDAS
jgi:hypothetical protein